MPTYSALQEIQLGVSDLTGPTVDFIQLPNGDLFALNYVQNSSTEITQSSIEILAPGANNTLTNVSSSSIKGAAPAGIGSDLLINELYVGDNKLPDIVLSDGGPDQAPWTGGQVRVLAPNASGQYVDVTSKMPKLTAYNHRLSTGEINGQAAIAVAMIGTQSGLREGIELVIANANGTFTDWSSHLPANIATLPNGTPGTYTCTAIADFTGNGGDLFLGSDQGFTDNVLLENNGSDTFTAHTISVAKPTATGGAASIALYAMPTEFAGDTHEDLIVVYTDLKYDDYALQFLKGNGKGGFSDVTAQHFANQPVLTNAFGQSGWVQSLQTVTINGLNDLILYQANGAPEILLNNGKDVYSASPVQVLTNSAANFPSDLTYSAWGTENGVQGFYGYTDANAWVFIPVTSAYLSPTSSTLDQPLANQLYLYGNGSGAGTAKSLDGTFETSISITVDAHYAAGVEHSVDLIVDGVNLGKQSIEAVEGNGGYTAFRTFTFNVAGVEAINSLQIVEDANAGLFVSDVQVDGVDLGSQTQWTSATTQTISAAAWNSASGAALGTAANPIHVTGSGTGATAHVLGDPNQYAVTSLGTSTVHLFESAGLDQNAVLTDVAFVEFQDGVILNTQTGTATNSAGQAVHIFTGAPSRATEDLNGDDKSDILIESAANAVDVGELLSGKEHFVAVTSPGAGWQIKGAGDFLGDGKDQFLVDDAGVFKVGEVSGAQVQYTQVGSLSTAWSFEEAGDFLGAGNDQFLVEGAGGAVDVAEIVSGKAHYTRVATVASEWSFVGAGDFLGAGKDEFLLQNSAGALEVGEVGSTDTTTYTQIGSVASGWKFEGGGDFLGDGKTDVLVWNTSGAMEVGEVGATGQLTYTQIGSVNAQWTFEAVGDYSGTGIDSFMVENTATHAIYAGTVVSGQIQLAQVGTVGSGWSFHG